MGELAQQIGAQAIFALRGGALASPEDLTGWHYAPSPRQHPAPTDPRPYHRRA
jgi:hypothetical protein